MAAMDKDKKKTYRRHIAISVFLSALCLAVIYALLGIWPLGDYVIVTGDMGGQYLPYCAWLKSAVSANASLGFTFEAGLGNAAAEQIGHLFTPLSWLLLLFPRQDLSLYFNVSVFFAIVASAGTMSAFLCRFGADNAHINILLSVCYSLMGYSVIYFQIYRWLYSAAVLPLVLYALCRALDTGRWMPFALSVALQLIAGYYIGYMVCIFCVLFFVWQTAFVRPLPGRQAIKSFVRFAGSGILGAGIAAAAFLPSALLAYSGKAPSFEVTFEPYFSPLALVKQIACLNFSAEQVVDGLPVIFCGSVVTVLTVIYFFCRGIPARERIGSGLLIAFFLISFLIPALNTLWHMGREPVWFPYRYSFILCAFLICISSRAAGAYKSGRQLTVRTALALFLLAAALAATQIPALGRRKIVLTTALLFAAAGLLWILGRDSRSRLKKAARVLLAVLVLGEMTYNGFYCMDKFEKYTLSALQARYTDIDPLLEAAGGGFYRLDKNFYYGFNDSMYFGYNGLNYFGSVQSSTANSIKSALGYASDFSDPTAVYDASDALLCVEYVITDAPADNGAWELVESTGKYYLYRNPLVCPFAFSAADVSAEMTDDPGENINLIFSGITGESETIVRDGQEDDAALAAAIERLTAGSAVREIAVESAGVSCVVESDSDGYVVFSMPYTAGMRCTVDGREVPLQSVFGGFSALRTQAGVHDITVRYVTPFLGPSAAISAASLLAAAVLYIREKRRLSSPKAASARETGTSANGEKKNHDQL